MEVHHHAHTARKKFAHYFWEFLMLFLAVFCGFLAENQREHIVEHQREKSFMKSMVVDLENDTSRFSQAYHGISKIVSSMDSLSPLMSSAEKMEANAQQIYDLQCWVSLYYKVIYTDRTISQLKNSGNFRLIRDSEVSNAIIAYDTYVRNYVLQMQDDYLWVEAGKLNDLGNKIFRSSVFRNWLKIDFMNNEAALPELPYFFSTEKVDINNYINRIQTYAVANEWFLQNLTSARAQAAKLDSLIKQEYHF